MAKSVARSHKPKALRKKNLRLRRTPVKKEYVIDRQAGLVFSSEKEMYAHFETPIAVFEKEYLKNRPADDIAEESVANWEDLLDLTLEEPAEIWHDSKTCDELSVFHFIRAVPDLNAVHVAVAYVNSEDEPTFILLNFMTKSMEMVEKYRRFDLVYDRAYEEVGFGMIEGDALTEGDPLAMGLFIAMLKVRGEKDVANEKFHELGDECREPTIEEADEIWRNADMSGHQLVTFIKEFPDHELRDLHYVAVTQEDAGSGVHSLLFSFPTTDSTLVDRYRHGENLQAEEVSQESSH
jgi:hypothetical protein